MYEPFEVQIKAWLEDEPALSAASVLQRLTKIDPSRFKEKNLRMVQRLVKAWRMEMAGLIILDGGWMKSWPLSSSAATEGDRGHVGPIALGNIPR
ncbi:hypothetical protein NKI31_28115 [Mesorhizobium sp. M0659]|uniref:hypothetical protein n=1 Tax=Mesorhizobium sp. M0659 TaxID=2956980 RepID=UPI00333AED34